MSFYSDIPTSWVQWWLRYRTTTLIINKVYDWIYRARLRLKRRQLLAYYGGLYYLRNRNRIKKLVKPWIISARDRLRQRKEFTSQISTECLIRTRIRRSIALRLGLQWRRLTRVKVQERRVVIARSLTLNLLARIRRQRKVTLRIVTKWLGLARTKITRRNNTAYAYGMRWVRRGRIRVRIYHWYVGRIIVQFIPHCFSVLTRFSEFLTSVVRKYPLNNVDQTIQSGIETIKDLITGVNTPEFSLTPVVKKAFQFDMYEGFKNGLKHNKKAKISPEDRTKILKIAKDWDNMVFFSVIWITMLRKSIDTLCYPGSNLRTLFPILREASGCLDMVKVHISLLNIYEINHESYKFRINNAITNHDVIFLLDNSSIEHKIYECPKCNRYLEASQFFFNTGFSLECKKCSRNKNPPDQIDPFIGRLFKKMVRIMI